MLIGRLTHTTIVVQVRLVVVSSSPSSGRQWSPMTCDSGHFLFAHLHVVFGVHLPMRTVLPSAVVVDVLQEPGLLGHLERWVPSQRFSL